MSLIEESIVNQFKGIDSLDSIHAKPEYVGTGDVMNVSVYLVFNIAHEGALFPMKVAITKLKTMFPMARFRAQQLDYNHQDKIPKDAVCLWYNENT